MSAPLVDPNGDPPAATSFTTPANLANQRRGLELLRERAVETVDSYPTIFHLDITGRCNLSCLYCVRDFYVATKHPFLKGDMPDEVFQKLRPHFAKARVVALLSNLGEPLVVKALPRWWREIHEAGAKPQTTTNGTFLTPELTDLFASTGGRLKMSIDSLVQGELDVLRPTMQADLLRDRLDLVARAKATHQNPRFQFGINVCVTAKNLETVVETMEECLERCPIDLFTLSGFRIPRDEDGNYHEAARALSLDRDGERTRRAWGRIIEWCKAKRDEGAAKFVLPFSRAEWEALLGPGIALPATEDVDDTFAAGQGYHCCTPWLKAHVLSDGTVIACTLLNYAERGWAMGNLKDQTFEQIWFGEKFQEFRRGMDQPPAESACGQCKSWWRFFTGERVD